MSTAIRNIQDYFTATPHGATEVGIDLCTFIDPRTLTDATEIDERQPGLYQG